VIGLADGSIVESDLDPFRPEPPRRQPCRGRSAPPSRGGARQLAGTTQRRVTSIAGSRHPPDHLGAAASHPVNLPPTSVGASSAAPCAPDAGALAGQPHDARGARRSRHRLRLVQERGRLEGTLACATTITLFPTASQIRMVGGMRDEIRAALPGWRPPGNGSRPAATTTRRRRSRARPRASARNHRQRDRSGGHAALDIGDGALAEPVAVLDSGEALSAREPGAGAFLVPVDCQGQRRVGEVRGAPA
jgi:hypothetical protein